MVLDEIGQRPKGSEHLAAGLLGVDPDVVFPLDGNDDLDRIERVEAEGRLGPDQGGIRRRIGGRRFRAPAGFGDHLEQFVFKCG
jgi:hypothetical protein